MQVGFSEHIEEVGYTALSYPMTSAHILFREAGYLTSPARQGREYSLLDRKKIFAQLLQLHCSAHRRDGNPDRTEFVWLDEFCLSEYDLQDDRRILEQRGIELGRLADICRNAAQVAVFCHEIDCDHTRLDCIWGNRLLTIPEILHAQNVLRLTRRESGNQITAQIFLIQGGNAGARSTRQSMASVGPSVSFSAPCAHCATSADIPFTTTASTRAPSRGRRPSIPWSWRPSGGTR
ncbi:hypothetical protein B0H10DRAFT_473770 [Mycena sp. CBHHK59/15]|nr:hypothetical protein B0H10DRAFT_473770 [Mycena sp. CBHHK59/15]